MGDSISKVENSVNDVTSLLEERGIVSDKTVQMDNRVTVNSNESTEERLVLLATEKAEDQKSDKIQNQRSEPGSLQIEKLGKHSQLVETKSNKTSVISKTSSARRVLYLKVKALKEPEELQSTLEKLKREAIQREIAELHEEFTCKARIAGIEVSHQLTVSRKTQVGWTRWNQPKAGLSPLLQYQNTRRQ